MMSENTGIIKNTKKIENADEFQESLKKAAERMKEGYIIAMLTDKIDIRRLEKVEEETFVKELPYKKVVEIRMFNKKGEVKWFRGSGQELWYRSIEDKENLKDLYYWDEEQYLDIDTKRSKPENGIAYATGGGKYPLPLDNYEDAKIKIRNYLKYEDDTKQLYISDWRVLDFIEKEGGIGHGNI